MESINSTLFNNTSKEKENISQTFELNFNDKIFLLTISFLNETNSNKEDKILNFKLKEKNINNFTYYESNRNLKDLAKLFLINNANYSEIFFGKLEKFHSENNILLTKSDNNEEIINLVYIQKIKDNDVYEITIELEKKENKNISSNEIFQLSNKIENLKKEFEEMRKFYEKKLIEKEEENNALKKLLKIKNNVRQIESINFQSEPDKLSEKIEIKEVVDGGRGMNDHFAVYNLVKDAKKRVYVAIKNKLENKENSYINIIKIKSIHNYKIKKRLYGHNRRIVFVKYFLDPYTDNEYLLSADKQQVVLVWKILDKNNYKRFCYINTFYGQLMAYQSIYSCIIFFTEKKNYIYTTSVTKNYGRLYELEDGSFLRNVTLTLYNYTLQLIKYKEYIIDICKDYIMIYNPFNEELYDKIERSFTYGENRSGCIVYNKNNTDYLCVTNENGYIIIYDLNIKRIIKIIKADTEFYDIISWNLKYLIVTAYSKNSLWIVDFDGNIKIDSFKGVNHVICVKKFLLNGEEIILCAGGQGFNSLYIYYSPKEIKNDFIVV